VERVADGRHSPSDVIVGAVMGTAVGIVVPLLHARPQPRRLGLTTGPGPAGGGGGGVAIGIQWQF
jgi:membrane-associated phospholipid phosphatase